MVGRVLAARVDAVKLKARARIGALHDGDVKMNPAMCAHHFPMMARVSERV